MTGVSNSWVKNDKTPRAPSFFKPTKFSPGQVSLEDGCQECEAGFYCPNSNQTSVDKVNHKCSAGYYCEAGSKTADPAQCPIGHQCPAGSPQVCS